MQVIDGAAIRSIPWSAVIDSLAGALRDGTQGEAPSRQSIAVQGGEMLVMPAQTARHFGAKLLGVRSGGAPGPRIQGLVVLFDQETLTPVALVDGAELTLRRTAGMSALGARVLSARPGHLAVFGAGPQARAHIEALVALGLVTSVNVRSRSRDRAMALERSLASEHPDIEIHSDTPLYEAAIIVCATTSSSPLFTADEISERATVLAIGSHTPDRREVGTGVMTDSFVAVDGYDAARREAGDVIIAERESSESVIDADLGELVRGAHTRPIERGAVFKSVGEGWQDLVVAGLLVREGAR